MNETTTVGWRTLPAGRVLDELVAERLMGLAPGQDFGVRPEHDWKREKSGEIDMWAHESDYDAHHGPFCSRCDYMYCVCVHCKEVPTEPCDVAPFKYSTDIRHAWKIVERMRTHPNPRLQNLSLIAYSYNRTYATFDSEAFDDDGSPMWVEANGEHATPLAICRAALTALPPPE